MIDHAVKADVLARARRMGSMLVTSAAPPQEVERVLLDVASRTPKEMLDAYTAALANYDTWPIDSAGDTLRIYPGQWSIISGFPGTGKTTLLRQLVCHLLREGKSVFVATLEADPEDYMVEIAATACGVRVPSEAQLAAFLDTYGDRLKIWGMVGMADHKKILATACDLADKEGVTHVVIDSLMALDVRKDDLEGQRQLAIQLTAIAKVKRLHIHLVAHPRKPLEAGQTPNQWDVAGASDLIQLAWNIIFIQRGPDLPGRKDISSTIAHVLKQRKLGRIGELLAYYYREQFQFHVEPMGQDPIRYLEEKHYVPRGMLSEEIPQSLIAAASYVERDTMDSCPWDV